jgi:hypothetical protein
MQRADTATARCRRRFVYWQRFPVQMCRLQSPLLLQSAPVPQFGEQSGGAHCPFRHRRARQSPLTAHGAPWLQFGEQSGGAQRLLVHLNDKQSPLSPQMAA